MHIINAVPRVYRHRGYTIEAIPRVCGPDGVWCHWRVRPDDGSACWDTYSLADAREAIDAGRPAEVA